MIQEPVQLVKVLEVQREMVLQEPIDQNRLTGLLQADQFIKNHRIDQKLTQVREVTRLKINPYQNRIAVILLNQAEQSTNRALLISLVNIILLLRAVEVQKVTLHRKAQTDPVNLILRRVVLPQEVLVQRAIHRAVVRAQDREVFPRVEAQAPDHPEAFHLADLTVAQEVLEVTAVVEAAVAAAAGAEDNEKVYF